MQLRKTGENVGIKMCRFIQIDLAWRVEGVCMSIVSVIYIAQDVFTGNIVKGILGVTIRMLSYNLLSNW